MLDKDDRKAIRNIVIGGVLVAIITGVFEPLRDFVLTPIRIRPVWLVLSVATAAGAIYFGGRRKTRLPQHHKGMSELPTVDQLVAASSEIPEWKSYTTDNYLDVDWSWRWDGTSIEDLTPLCPECGFELRAVAPTHYVEGEPYQDLQCLNCDNPDCQFQRDFADFHAIADEPDLHEYVKRYIMRQARRKGYDAA